MISVTSDKSGLILKCIDHGVDHSNPPPTFPRASVRRKRSVRFSNGDKKDMTLLQGDTTLLDSSLLQSGDSSVSQPALEELLTSGQRMEHLVAEQSRLSVGENDVFLCDDGMTKTLV